MDNYRYCNGSVTGGEIPSYKNGGGGFNFPNDAVMIMCFFMMLLPVLTPPEPRILILILLPTPHWGRSILHFSGNFENIVLFVSFKFYQFDPNHEFHSTIFVKLNFGKSPLLSCPSVYSEPAVCKPLILVTTL